MKKLVGILLGFVFVFTVAGSVNATQLITNGDFETGDLSDWTTSGNVQVVDIADMATLPAWLASVQGMEDNFALLGWGTGSGDSTLNQAFTVSNATSITLSFDYAFDFIDVNPWADDTFLALTTYTGDIAGTVTMLDIQSSLIGANYGHYEETFTLDPAWTIDAEMTFTLSEIGGFFSGGTLSMAGLDNISAESAPIPEPATIILLGLGLLGLVGVSRKKLKK